jgi:hypothetical protein
MRIRSRPQLFVLLLVPLLALAAAGAFAGQDKAYVCHINGDGTYNLIHIGDPAYPAHIDHGDMDPIDFWADNDADGFGAGPMFFDCVVPPGLSPTTWTATTTPAPVPVTACRMAMGTCARTAWTAASTSTRTASAWTSRAW